MKLWFVTDEISINNKRQFQKYLRMQQQIFLERFKKFSIQPLKRLSDSGSLHKLLNFDPLNTSLFDGVAIDPTPVTVGFRPIHVINTYHKYVNGVDFQPRYYEVIAVIPETIIESVNAFEIIDRFVQIHETGYGVAGAILYQNTNMS